MHSCIDQENTPIENPPRGRSRVLKIAIRCLIGTLVLLGILGWILYSAAQKEPEFYLAALAVSEQDRAREGDNFEKQLLELQNEARTESDWQVEFSESQVNGWLAADLPKKFPNALPRNITDPRVGILENELRMAFRFNSVRFKGIMQVQADVFCTEVPGQIAIQIKRVGTGFVPIPINSIADRVTAALRRIGLGVEWTEIDSDPVALIDLPPDKVKIGDKRIVIESIQLLENRLVLIGRSIEIE